MLRRCLKIGTVGLSIVTVHNKKNQFSKSQFLLRAEEVKVEKFKSKECILVIGTTGTGKSSTISQCTRQKDVIVSGQSESVTRHCQVYSDLTDESKPVWIDTVGYDDTTNVDDEETFKSILKYIQEHQLTQVRAIIWTVMPQERRDARLQRQADFINRFREENIWSNVIMIVKEPGPGASSLLRASQGAEEAARKYCQGVDQRRVLGFTYMNEKVPSDFRMVLESLDDGKRQSMLYYLPDEVNDKVRDAIDTIEEPVKVIFEDSRCDDCGVVGDKRLLPDFCHMEKTYQHPQPLKHFHSQDLQSYHPLPIENLHPGVLRLTGGPNETCETVKNVLVAMTPVMGLLRDTSEGVKTGILAAASYVTCYNLHTPLRFTFGCCEGDENSLGCKVSHGCCRRPAGTPGCLYTYPCCAGGPQASGCQRKYLCCGKSEGAVGCNEICRKCEQKWGTSTTDCFKRPHNLIKIAI